MPEVLEETVDSGHVDVLNREGVPTVELDDLVGATDKDGVSPGISFSVDYAFGGAEPDGSLAVLPGYDPEVAAYVQPTQFGVRVLTEISGPNAPESYQYTFDVPADTRLVERNYSFYLESGDKILGTLKKPWATDANGNDVPTWYSWEQGRLTQHVELTAQGIAFPVVADPAWGYTYYYDVSKTAAKNKSLLRSCFNCYFPVAGAPKVFPKPGQILPLRVVGLNFECKFKSEFSSGTEYFGFQFDATKNHVDKLGSNIIFEFVTIGGKKKLVVDAYIVNDAIWIANPVYATAAKDNWKKFAKNLNNAK